MTHRDGEDDFRVAGEVGNVTVQGDPLLCCPGLAHGQRDTQDGVGTKLCCGSYTSNDINSLHDVMVLEEFHQQKYFSLLHG